MRKSKNAITLIEVLVVISTLGLLMALLLPAMIAVRERSRQAICRQNLRQISLGLLQHVEAFGRYPANGWGYAWVGDPNRNTNAQQPGGWIYNVTPYVQPRERRYLGRGEEADAKSAALAQLIAEPVPLFHCPSRGGGRRCRPIPIFG